jgi:outer membrane protein OmpA-like peptidoglycan-associated protein/tetratricopeptide (TPR) repeat protein
MHKLYSILFFIFFLAGLHASAQQQIPPQLEMDLRRAKMAFDNKKYNTAATLYKKLYGKIRDEDQKNEMLYMIAESYRRANNFKQAFDWYERLVNTKYPDIRIIYSYGLLLKNFERYDEASRQFYDYLFEVPGDKNAIREMQSCKDAQYWKAHPQRFTVKPLNDLNTEFSDYSPFYSQGRLIWASSRPEATGNEIFEWTGQKCSDFFESVQSNGTWSKPANLKGGINTNFNEGAGWIDSTGTTLYYTQCNGSDGKGMNCKIYVSYKQNNEWTAPKVLPFCSDSFSVGHPAMSPDGKRMYFASDMPGGFGEKDIYYIPYTAFNDTWGTPVNLGSLVNTNEDDMFPHAAADGTIYFSSKGWPGMGGLDIYKTADSANTFRKAENLQSPVNSGGDDFGISFVPASEISRADDPIAYYCSNRNGTGKGDDDIYSISVKPFIFIVKGKVIDKETGLVLPAASVNADDTATKNLFSVRSDEKGEFLAELPLEQYVLLTAQKDKYFKSAPAAVSSVGMQKDSTVEVVLYVDPIPSDDYEFTLKGIYYDLDKADIRPEAAKVLDSLVTILNNNTNITIELASHTDSRADEAYNLKLSQRRAQSCVDYLLKKGIAKDRLTAVGYGESRLVNDCADGVDCTEEEHQENRRTTFRVLSTDYKKKR